MAMKTQVVIHHNQGGSPTTFEDCGGAGTDQTGKLVVNDNSNAVLETYLPSEWTSFSVIKRNLM